MNFSPQRYSVLKSRLRKKYSKDLTSVLKELRKFPEHQIVNWLSEYKSELKDFTPLNWLLLSNIKSLLYFCYQPADLGKNSFGLNEEAVFEKWNNSEFADKFLKRLNQGMWLGKASEMTLKDLDNHLVVFAQRQLLRNNSISKAYRLQSSLGEYEKHKKIMRHLETTLHFEGKDLKLMTMTLREMKIFSQRIEVALKVIRKFSPSSWQRFVNFTDVIIPIKQQELVSYSHQDLPGFSMINLFHRDFVDLMDDLLHENGHHHLNYYLNLGKLIDEPTENIYYSPWRRTLRPLRGVFHAYFTFFWAFKLFSDLARAKDIDSIYYLFSESEREKVYWRAVEEYYMLDYTFQELKWARDQGLIKKSGWVLIEEQQTEIQKSRKLVPSWEKKIRTYKKELKGLKESLRLAQKKYLSK
jgi:hypothetical protein